MYLVLDRGRPRFPQDFRVPLVLRNSLREISICVRGFHLLWPPIPRCSSIDIYISYRETCNPRRATPGFRLLRFRSPLLTESRDFFSSRYLRCFSSMVSLSYANDYISATFTIELSRFTKDGFPIRKPPDRRIITPPRRISLLYTSFLGMNTQGIHCQLYSVAENKGGYQRCPIPCLYINEINFCKGIRYGLPLTMYYFSLPI